MTDIGTGSYTIIAQTAAETMGLDINAVEVRLGNSAYPTSSGSGGQFGAASSTAGVYAACVALQNEIAKRLGIESPRFENGRVVSGDTDLALGMWQTARNLLPKTPSALATLKTRCRSPPSQRILLR
ncbi:hypothetical protein HSBAA_64140 [Vreelandella sulfidaeris]|uniref:Aldehyde oxidase/xanthine dehydrogenase second molybdopterin binding domain-containing protein n=1 Tax=Vreelandella sulfidaeris TaxID=115553 RepID=A0A455UL82_9GAMM|nr:hypothetical protein HSBAA_64140 [Halomonas sulfidaeris]